MMPVNKPLSPGARLARSLMRRASFSTLGRSSIDSPGFDTSVDSCETPPTSPGDASVGPVRLDEEEFMRVGLNGTIQEFDVGSFVASRLFDVQSEMEPVPTPVISVAPRVAAAPAPPGRMKRVLDFLTYKPARKLSRKDSIMRTLRVRLSQLSMKDNN